MRDSHSEVFLRRKPCPTFLIWKFYCKLDTILIPSNCVKLWWECLQINNCAGFWSFENCKLYFSFLITLQNWEVSKNSVRNHEKRLHRDFQSLFKTRRRQKSSFQAVYGLSFVSAFDEFTALNDKIRKTNEPQGSICNMNMKCKNLKLDLSCKRCLIVERKIL